MFWIMGKIIILAGVFVVLFTFGLLYLNTHPPKYPKTAGPYDYNLSFEEVEFTADDNVKLKGWFLPSESHNRAPAIIICHGLGASKSDFVELSSYLVKSGFNVLLFDFRAHGESSGRSCSLGLNEQRDVRAAVDLLDNRTEVDTSKIGIYGFSLGGTVALLHSAKDKRVIAVVADSPFSNLKTISAEIMKKAYYVPPYPFIEIGNIVYRLMFGKFMDQVNPERYIADISPRAVFLIAGDNDEMISIKHAYTLFEASCEPRDLWVVDGALHGGTLMFAQDLYYAKVARFFKDNFKKESK